MNNKTEYLGLSLKPRCFLRPIICLGLIFGLGACSNGSSSADASDMANGIDQEMSAMDMLSVPCAGETSGEVNGGEVSAGEVSAGEVSAGEVSAGEVSAGEVSAGEVSAGEMSAGEVSAGEPSAGEMSAGNVAGAEMTVNPEASSRYDGTYFATFESDGLKTALARVEVRLGLIEGEVLNHYGELIQLGGFIDERGMLRIPPLAGNMGSTFNATGRISRLGIIEGTFTVSGVVDWEGSFLGSLENQAIYRPSPEYDGLYDLSFIRDEQEVAVTSMSIDQGRFSLGIVNSSGLRFEAQGFVSEDGTLALLGTNPIDVLAEGYIDPDTKSIKGIYVVGRGEEALIGDISGREAD